MGLDIVALRRAELQTDAEEDTAYEDGYFMAYPNSDFPDHADDMDEGYYSGTEAYQFRAGSYSGYNSWRDWLSRTMLGVDPEDVWRAPQAYEGQPFVELIHFADNEGMIGPLTSAKLAKDFIEHDRTAYAADEPDGYFYELYRSWRHAFELAADSGLVQFA